MKTKQASSLAWYNKKGIAVLIAIVSLVLAYAIGLRAIDTGSLQQYCIAGILMCIAGNRIIRIVSRVRPRKEKIV